MLQILLNIEQTTINLKKEVRSVKSGIKLSFFLFFLGEHLFFFDTGTPSKQDELSHKIVCCLI